MSYFLMSHSHDTLLHYVEQDVWFASSNLQAQDLRSVLNIYFFSGKISIYNIVYLLSKLPGVSSSFCCCDYT